MKKLTAFLLALVMILVLCACGGTPTRDRDTDSVTSDGSAVPETIDQTDNGEESQKLSFAEKNTLGEVGELTITNAFASDTLEPPITSGVYTTYSPGDG